MEKNGEIKQKGHLYQMGHNPFRSFYAGIDKAFIIKTNFLLFAILLSSWLQNANNTEDCFSTCYPITMFVVDLLDIK
jgi:hypothetical protein